MAFSPAEVVLEKVEGERPTLLRQGYGGQALNVQRVIRISVMSWRDEPVPSLELLDRQVLGHGGNYSVW